MSNILVISDTHGNAAIINQLLKNYEGMLAAVVHLGDYARDIARFARAEDASMFHIVNGNTDPLVEAYDERVIEIAGKRIFISHGHRYSVKTGLDNIMYKARELGVAACLFGHTHVPTLFEEAGILFMNPGSPTYPNPDTPRGYALLRIAEDGNISGKLLEYREPAWLG